MAERIGWWFTAVVIAVAAGLAAAGGQAAFEACYGNHIMTWWDAPAGVFIGMLIGRYVWDAPARERP